MADYGIKFMRPGYTLDDQDERHVSLWTKYKLYKIEGNTSGTVSSGGNVTFQGGRNYSPGIKDTANTRWYMAGATGVNNAGFAGLSAFDSTVIAAPSTVYGNVSFTWKVTVTGVNLPYYVYYTSDIL